MSRSLSSGKVQQNIQENKKIKEWIIKMAVIISGSMIAAYGMTLGIHAGYGGATLAILWVGVSKVTGMSIGMASFVIAVCMIVFVFFYDRRQIYIGTIIYQVVYSSCLDLFGTVHRYSGVWWIDFLIMCVGITVFAVGTGLYASADFGRGSYEALTFSLASKNRWPVKNVRMTLDILLAVSGVALGGRFGACTIVTILISGPIIQTISRTMQKKLKYIVN